ncbi:MAG TPA: glycosyltransferase family 4 protein, partial [Abditibacteriaceae bacterium]|nr:glycosyltransferase family 4 protein [Abditibacteriaceae bacterium]
MKIALSFPGCHRRGGVERIMLECAHFLAERDHDVHVYAQQWEEDEAHRIQFHAVPQPPSLPHLRGSIYKRECEKMLRNTHYDVLNTHGVVCPAGGVLWTQSIHRAWLEKSKTMRAPWSVSRWKQRLNPLHRVLLQLEEEHYGGRTDQKIIATTKDVRDDLHRLYNVPHEDVIIIPNGFNPVEFNPARRAARREEMRAQLGLKPEQIVLLFVANELERKGYHTLLDALRRLKRHDLRLVC